MFEEHEERYDSEQKKILEPDEIRVDVSVSASSIGAESVPS